MIENLTVDFSNGRVLNQYMLQQLQIFSLQDIKITYNSYSDGIITGFDFLMDSNTLYLSPGILKFNGMYFFSGENTKVATLDEIENFTANETNKDVFIYLKKSNDKCRNNITSIILEPVLLHEKSDNSEYVYMGYFEFYHGLPLSVTYKDFRKLENKRSTINILQREYAGKNGKTISPMILHLFAKENLKKNFYSNLDYYIFNKGLDNEIVEIDILNYYLQLSEDNNDFISIYEALCNKEFEIIEEKEENIKVDDRFGGVAFSVR